MSGEGQTGAALPEEEFDPEELRVARALGEFLAGRGAGEEADRSGLLRDNPELAGPLEEALEAADQVTFLARTQSLPSAFGDFRLLREAGRGGMGIVHEAWQVSLNRRVALKILPGGLLADPRAQARFRREATVAGRLQHDHIVQIYGMGVEDGVPYFAMEFVEGETLRQIQQRLGRKSGGAADSNEAESQPPAPVPEAPADGSPVFGNGLHAYRGIAAAFAGVAEGLQHAHAGGVVHRDLKPSNLILDRSGKLRILDFGLALVEGEEPLTLTEERLGTPLYMSPEQAQGGKERPGIGTDIYSLGATLYEVLTGRPPFVGKNHHEVLNQITHRDPLPPRRLNPAIPRELENIVLKCLRKEPRARYATAEALSQDLRRWVRGDPIEAVPLSTWEKVARKAWRWRWQLSWGTAALLLISGVTFAVTANLERARLEREERYEKSVLGAVMKMHQRIFALPEEEPRRRLRGDYPEWYFIPQEGALMDRRDFLTLVRGSGRNPLEEAVEDLKGAIQIIPDRPDAHYHRSRGLFLLDREAQAREELEAAVSRHGGSAPELALLAFLRERAGETQGAAAARDAAVRAGGEEFTAAWLEAHRATVARDWRAAAKAFSRLNAAVAAAVKPCIGAPVEALLGRGVARLQLRDYRHAIEDFQETRGGWRSALEPMLLLGKAYFLQGEREAAAAKFEELFALHPVADEAALSISDLYGSLGENPEALRWADRIVDPGLRERNRAAFLFKLGSWPEAAQAAAAAVELRREDVLAKLWLGLALLVGEGKSPEAEALFRRILAREPGNFLAHVWLGDALARQAKLDEALEEYRLAAAIHAEMALVHVSQGVTLERMNRIDEALAEFLIALEQDPHLLSVYIHLNMIFDRVDQLDFGPRLERLTELLEKSLEDGEGNPLLPEVHRVLALALSRKKDPDSLAKAVRHGTLAVETSGRRHPSMLRALARAQFAAGERAEAVSSLEEALSLPHASQILPDELALFRKAIQPDLASYASIDAALAALDRKDLIPPGATWRFFRGTKEPSPGSEWSQVGFDDSGWESGPTGIGFGDGDDATVLSDMVHSYTTVYLRREFHVEGPAPYRALHFSLRVDDGAIVYLNGQQVARPGAGPGETPLPFDAVSVGVVMNEPLPALDFVLDAKHLLSGKNVLAIQGLNAKKDSSDLSLIPSLAGEVDSDPDADRKLLEAFRAAHAAEPPPARFAGRAAYLEGRIQERAGCFRAADLKFAEAARLDPTRVEPVLARGRSLRALGQLEEAEEWYRQARDHAFPREVSLWDAWVTLMLVDLKRPPAAVLARLPLPSVEDTPEGTDSLPSRAYGLDIRWALDRLHRGEPILIRCGADACRDRQGRLWGRDRFHGAGFAYGETIWTLMIPQRAAFYEGDIAKTEDDPLYQSERWFPADEISRYYYRIPLPPGRYRVVLHCAEVFVREPGKRSFGIRLEGKQVRPLYEPFQAGFATADRLPFVVEVADGFLDLDLEPILQNPKLSALEIEPAA